MRVCVLSISESPFLFYSFPIATSLWAGDLLLRRPSPVSFFSLPCTVGGSTGIGRSERQRTVSWVSCVRRIPSFHRGSDRYLPRPPREQPYSSPLVFMRLFLFLRCSLVLISFGLNSFSPLIVYYLSLWFLPGAAGVCTLRLVPVCGQRTDGCAVAKTGWGHNDVWLLLDSPYGPWLRAPLPVWGRGMPLRRAAEVPRASGSGSQRGATIFGSFSGFRQGAAVDLEDEGQAHRPAVPPTSAASFSPECLFRQACTGVPGGTMQGAGMVGEGRSDGPSIGDEGLVPGTMTSPVATVGSPVVEDMGTEDSVEFVSSTILETRSTGLLTTQGFGVDRLGDDLMTVPLQFNAHGPPRQRGLGRRGRPRGSGRVVSRKRTRGCSVLGPKGEIPRNGKRRLLCLEADWARSADCESQIQDGWQGDAGGSTTEVLRR
ncbi:hypothetical protein Salat_2739100 [Sesamum alatum]|uniref:Uncharacterized protein n=1 Tax=Sesamum alatum TaxID=300844 RepID=A0AAE1XJT5_9LAMI|nr:hypothetical protein Salat_2739100 [Sesamum alatum]